MANNSTNIIINKTKTNNHLSRSIFMGIWFLNTYRRIQGEGIWGAPRPPIFELSYILVKTLFNRIFLISSFFFLPCFVIFALNYTSVSYNISGSKLFWNPICFLKNVWIRLWYQPDDDLGKKMPKLEIALCRSLKVVWM